MIRCQVISKFIIHFIIASYVISNQSTAEIPHKDPKLRATPANSWKSLREINNWSGNDLECKRGSFIGLVEEKGKWRMMWLCIHLICHTLRNGIPSAIATSTQTAPFICAICWAFLVWVRSSAPHRISSAGPEEFVFAFAFVAFGRRDHDLASTKFVAAVTLDWVCLKLRLRHALVARQSTWLTRWNSSSHRSQDETSQKRNHSSSIFQSSEPRWQFVYFHPNALIASARLSSIKSFRIFERNYVTNVRKRNWYFLFLNYD